MGLRLHNPRLIRPREAQPSAESMRALQSTKERTGDTLLASAQSSCAFGSVQVCGNGRLGMVQVERLVGGGAGATGGLFGAGAMVG